MENEFKLLQFPQPNKMGGLFNIKGHSPVTITFDWNNSLWLVNDDEEIVDDVLTRAYIYTFGTEDFKRLVIERPSRQALDTLVYCKADIPKLTKEFPPKSKIFSFGILPEAETEWQNFIEARRGYHKDIFASLSSGLYNYLGLAA